MPKLTTRPGSAFSAASAKRTGLSHFLQRPTRQHGRPGLVAVGVAQERANGWRGTKRKLEGGGITFEFSLVSVYVNVYYLYIWDTEWGPTFIKLSGYAP